MNQRGGWLDIEKGRRGWSCFQRLSQNIRIDIFFFEMFVWSKTNCHFFTVIYVIIRNEKELYIIYTIFDLDGWERKYWKIKMG